ncbi:hypothetical protein D9619_008288 [Psilocybe cf. subviscida]|uniref:Uncharacterized protein n=1 Tax=Psilocybe cf. subviscida TaxID=2480587 RepID=A0A8H5B9Q1_9AGAR|nr:hypothetical protein D9619_008288 [Psilocybe cf. subviscida]
MYELIYSILQAVDNTSDLLSLALCCTLLREEAQRLLFFHPIPSRHQQKRFLATIIKSPSRLALMVHRFALRYPVAPDRPSERGVSSDLAFALRAMRKLKRLRVDTSGIYPGILQGCTFKLDVFVWGSLCITQDLTSLLAGFLPWQPNLRHLGLFGTINGERVNPLFIRALCPKLESLATSSNSVVDIFFSHHRPIQSLQWMLNSIGPTSTSPQLSQIKSYRVIVGNLTRELPILRHLTSLVLLELTTAKPGAHLMFNNKMDFLEVSSNLRVLILTSDSPYPDPPRGESSPPPYFDVIRNAFDACKTLRYIDVSIPSVRPGRKYERFFPPRDLEDPVRSAILRADEIETRGGDISVIYDPAPSPALSGALSEPPFVRVPKALLRRRLRLLRTHEPKIALARKSKSWLVGGLPHVHKRARNTTGASRCIKWDPGTRTRRAANLNTRGRAGVRSSFSPTIQLPTQHHPTPAAGASRSIAHP